jgi:hypothetical protein
MVNRTTYHQSGRESGIRDLLLASLFFMSVGSCVEDRGVGNNGTIITLW